MVRKHRIKQEWQQKEKIITKHKKSKDKKTESSSEDQSQNSYAQSEVELQLQLQLQPEPEQEYEQKNKTIENISKQDQIQQPQLQIQQILFLAEKDAIQENIVENKQILIEQPINTINIDNEYKDKMKEVIARINSHSSSQRISEWQSVQQFIVGNIAPILYIAGITGSGKTTMVTNIITKLNQSFTQSYTKVSHILINMIKQYKNAKQEFIINKITDFVDKSIQDSIKVLIIDECDYANDLEGLVFKIRDQFVDVKIVLISNENCMDKINNHEQFVTVFFMPYTKEDLLQITKAKLGTLFDMIPNIVIAEAFKKSLIRSGDYRQVQYHITDWAQSHLNGKLAQPQTSMGPSSNHFKNPFLQSIQKYLQKSTQNQKLLLKTILQINPDKKDTSKKMRCRCKQAHIEKVKKLTRLILTEQQILMKIIIWQQIGLLQILSVKCSIHERVFRMGNLKFRVQMQYLKEVMRSL